MRLLLGLITLVSFGWFLLFYLLSPTICLVVLSMIQGAPPFTFINLFIFINLYRWVLIIPLILYLGPTFLLIFGIFSGIHQASGWFLLSPTPRSIP